MSWLTDRLTRTGTGPYPATDLAAALGIPTNDPHLIARLAYATRLNRGHVRRYTALGLTIWQAETWATRAGLNPINVWPTWGTELPDPCCDNYDCTCTHQEAI